MKLLYVVLLLTLTTLAFAQRTITGTITDLNGNPLSDVMVMTNNDTIQTSSDTQGKYSINVPQTSNMLQFSKFNFTNQFVDADKDVVDVVMQPLYDVDLLNTDIEDLLNMQITTAGKTEQKISDIPSSVVVITRADLEGYGYQSLKEILSNVLGMYKIDDYRGANFGVRGFFSNVYNRNIVFMINGVVQQQAYQNWNDLMLMNLQIESIDHIEIVRGPMAVLYGNDAFFGAINIVTHQKKEPIQSSATIAYGTNNTYRGNIQVANNGDQTSFNVSAGYFYTNGRNVPFSKILDSVQRYDGTWIKNGSTKDFFRQNSRYINLSLDHKGVYTNLSYDETQRNLIHLWLPVYDTVKLAKTDYILRTKIGYRRAINSAFSFDAYCTYENMQGINHDEMGTVSPKMNYGELILEVRKITAELITFIKPLKNMTITSGINYNAIPRGYILTDIPVLSYDRNKEMLHTPSVSFDAFSQIEYTIGKVHLLGGIRANKQHAYSYKNSKYVAGVYKDTIYQYNHEKTHIIPRLAAVYNISDNKSLKIMYSQAISRPGVYENSYIRWVKHTMLIPQTIATYELNYTSMPIHQLTYSFSVFFNQLDNLINRRTISNTTTGKITHENNNTGKMQTIGSELQVLYKPIAKLKLDAAVSYQKTTNLLFDINAAYSPNVLAYLKGIYAIKPNITLSMSSYFTGSMEADWDETPIDPQNGNFTPKGRIYKTTPAYVNISANVRFDDILNKNIYFSLHADNLLGRDIFYPPTLTNVSYLPKGSYDSGIQLNTTFGIKF